MALKFTASNWNNYDSVRVGLDPSEETGLVEILTDPDKNGVFKITDKDTQKFVIEARDGATIIRKEYSLSGLTLTVPVSHIFDKVNCEDKKGYFSVNSQSVEITQNLTAFADNAVMATGNYVGEISGEITEGRRGSYGTVFIYAPIKDEVIEYLNSLTPADLTMKRYTIIQKSKDSNNTVTNTQTSNFPVNSVSQIKDFCMLVKDGSAELEVEIKAVFSDDSTSDSITITYDVGNLTLPA